MYHCMQQQANERASVANIIRCKKKKETNEMELLEKRGQPRSVSLSLSLSG